MRPLEFPVFFSWYEAGISDIYPISFPFLINICKSSLEYQCEKSKVHSQKGKDKFDTN